jgi:hypothetical protein
LILSDLGVEPDWNGIDIWFGELKKPKIVNKLVA